MRRAVLTVLAATVLWVGSIDGAAAQEGEGDGDGFIPGTPTTIPIELPPDFSLPVDTTTPPTTVPPDETTTTALPAGCSPPTVPHAVFVGELTAADARTARFRVIELTSGSLAGFQVGELVDVDFGVDVTYLDTGEGYLVSAAVDDNSGRLISKAKPTLARFGGDQVVGVDDRDVVCPTFDDPVISKMADGTSIETGVLAPMLQAKGRLLWAVLRPAGVAFGALLVLVAIKRTLVVLARRFRRGRRHRHAVAGLSSRRLRLPSSAVRAR